MTTISDELVGYYKNTCSIDWHWFEPYLTYVNGRIPQALFETYRETKQTKYLLVAEDSLNFLLDVQMMDGEFVPVGSKGWYKKGEARTMYDQQSVETASMTEQQYRLIGQQETPTTRIWHGQFLIGFLERTPRTSMYMSLQQEAVMTG